MKRKGMHSKRIQLLYLPRKYLPQLWMICKVGEYEKNGSNMKKKKKPVQSKGANIDFKNTEKNLFFKKKSLKKDY